MTSSRICIFFLLLIAFNQSSFAQSVEDCLANASASDIADFDGDGVIDTCDEDDDNDGVTDSELFPFDSSVTETDPSQVIKSIVTTASLDSEGNYLLRLEIGISVKEISAGAYIRGGQCENNVYVGDQWVSFELDGFVGVGVLNLGPYTPSCTYYINDLRYSVLDYSYMLTGSYFESIGADTSAEIVNPKGDSLPPQISSLQVGEPIVDDSGEAVIRIPISASFIDEGAGLEDSVSINALIQGRTNLYWNTFSLNDQGVAEGYLQLPANAPNGNYDFEIRVSDKVNNSVIIHPQTLSELALPTGFSLNHDQADDIAPELLGLQLNYSYEENTSRVQVLYQVSNPDELRYGYIRLGGPDGFGNEDQYISSGDVIDISANFSPGLYYPHFIFFVEESGLLTTYSYSDLIALDSAQVQSRFRVIQNEDAIPAQVPDIDGDGLDNIEDMDDDGDGISDTGKVYESLNLEADLFVAASLASETGAKLAVAESQEENEALAFLVHDAFVRNEALTSRFAWLGLLVSESGTQLSFVDGRSSAQAEQFSNWGSGEPGSSAVERGIAIQSLHYPGFWYARSKNDSLLVVLEREGGIDNCPNVWNADQLDTDEDGVGDVCDDDRDNDGVADASDAFPNDPSASLDSDADGAPDSWNDGYGESDSTMSLALDDAPFDASIQVDSDSDGVDDKIDAFPFDPLEQVDTDQDGLGDNADDDDDNDGLLDHEELGARPSGEPVFLYLSADNAFELYFNGAYIGEDQNWYQAKRFLLDLTDGKNVIAVKGIDLGGPGALIASLRLPGSELVTDRYWLLSDVENDTWYTRNGTLVDSTFAIKHGDIHDDRWWGRSEEVFAESEFPADSSAQWVWSANIDGDDELFFRRTFYFTNPRSADTDQDGILDGADAAPLDPSLEESIDTDGDSVADIYDDFPEDPSESSDIDLDGVGDNTDNCPVAPNSDQTDSDNNSIGDACEVQTVVADLADEGLRSCLASVTAQSLEEVRELDCSSRGIASVAGIEQFYRVTKLDLSGNSLNSIDPLAQLNNLSSLKLRSTRVDSLGALSALPLKELDLSDAGLESLEGILPSAGTLEVLSIHFNQVVDLSPISSQPRLVYLGMQGNPVDWNSFPQNLDQLAELMANGTGISNTSQLPPYIGKSVEILDIGVQRTGLTDLSGLEPFDQLRELWVHYNSDLDWSSLPEMESLERLYAYETGIQSLHQLSILKDGLQYLDVAHHSMESLDGIELFTKLTGMNAAYNQISDLSHLTRPISLNLGGNQITNLTPLSIYSDASGLQIQLWDNPFRRIGDLFRGWTDIRISFEKQSSQTTEWLSCQEIDYVKSYLDESVAVEWPTYSDCWDDPDRDYLYEFEDAFPMDIAASVDTDEDGKPDNWNEGFGASDSTSTPQLVLDLDDDNDETPDALDPFPLDSTEWADFDGDGLGDNADPDDDNDGISDVDDAFPYDAAYRDDTDGDGLPDAWESAYFLDPTDPQDAYMDPDQDGYLNWEEFLLGTDPNDPERVAQVLFADKPATLIPGRSSRLTMRYTTTDLNPNLTGLGVRIHYDSRYVTSVTLENVFQTGLIGVNEAQADTFDLDNDPLTDVYLLVSWASFSGAVWPGDVPTDLFDVVIDATEEIQALTVYPIRFSVSDTTDGYNLSAESVYNPVIAASLDVDGDGQAKALTDGLLIIRRLFGFSGSSLTVGAVSSGATVTDPAAIAERIDSFADGFDVDASGDTKALTDGLLIIRRLFGFSGSSLTVGAVGGQATRTDPAEIAAYIDGLIPSTY